MTAVARGSTPLMGARSKPRSPLESVLQNERRDLIDTLGRTIMRMCHVSHHAAEEVVAMAVVTAISWERAGRGWDPEGDETIDQYMLNRVTDALRDSRRTARRKPATPTGDIHDVASSAKGGLVELVASAPETDDEVEELRKLAAELRRHFEEETGGRIPLGIMDHHLRGIDEHARIANELKCTIAEVRAGWARLKYHAKRMAAAARGKKGRS